MQTGEMRPFATKPQCPFREFVVQKEFEEGDEDSPSYFYFYAVSRSQGGQFIELAGSTHTHKYQYQVAFIRCIHGWIGMLNVFERSLGIENENPRGCGIGIVLTELCLIDPEVSTMKVHETEDIGNRAMQILRRKGGYMEGLVKENCYKVVGLTMTATPPSAGHVYFSAAINMGYDKMIVDLSGMNVKYNVYDTKVAKQFYRWNGDIDECCNLMMYNEQVTINEKCSAYSRIWIFCANLNSFFPKFGKMSIKSNP